MYTAVHHVLFLGEFFKIRKSMKTNKLRKIISFNV